MSLQIMSYTEARAKGFKRYFTGRPCRVGHLVERYAADGSCVECTRIQNSVWAAANKERKVLQARRYSQKHTEKIRARSREWNQRNREIEAVRKRKRRDAIQDLLNVLRSEMPELLKEFGL